MKRRLLTTVVIAVAVISIGAFAAYYPLQSYLQSTRIPTEKELPDRVILDNQRNLTEVKTFLSKYPNANIFVDRSGRLAVDYWTHKQLSADTNDTRTLRLRVFSDNEGRPQEIYLDCPDGKNAQLIFKNIVNYIESEKCWTTPYYKQ